MPRYDEDVRFAAKTADRFERLQADQAAEAEICPDEKRKHSLLFANWMIGRRIVTYRRFADCQLAGKHEVARILDGKRVCTCGLITEVSANGKAADSDFATSEGHL
jgi:hypothetical protein